LSGVRFSKFSARTLVEFQKNALGLPEDQNPPTKPSYESSAQKAHSTALAVGWLWDECAFIKKYKYFIAIRIAKWYCSQHD